MVQGCHQNCREPQPGDLVRTVGQKSPLPHPSSLPYSQLPFSSVQGWGVEGVSGVDAWPEPGRVSGLFVHLALPPYCSPST